jgi:hypothetical protein
MTSSGPLLQEELHQPFEEEYMGMLTFGTSKLGREL